MVRLEGQHGGIAWEAKSGNPNPTYRLARFGEQPEQFTARADELMDLWCDYWAHGLRLRSAIELPLPSSLPLDASLAPDVTIRCGDLPAAISRPIAERRLTAVGRRGFWQATGSEFLIEVEKAGRFYVGDGGEVRVRPNAEVAETGRFFVRVLLPLLLQQKGLVTLHASAVATATGAVLFLGSSGAGKSTLAAALTQLGHPLMADDVAAVAEAANGQVEVLPATPRTKLRTDAMECLSLNTEAHERVNGLGKFYVSPPSFRSSPLPVRTIYLLEKAPPDAEFAIKTLSKLDALQALSAHTYKRIYLFRLGRRTMHLQRLSELVRQASMHRVTRPDGALQARELALRVLAHFANARSLVARQP